MKLLIVRHGQTAQNIKHIVQGHTHGELSAEGKKQAELLGKRLAEEPIDCIYSSDLGRAKETADIIHSFQPKTPLIFSKEIRERTFGEYDGKSSAELGWVQGKPILEHHNYHFPPGGETIPQMRKRAKNFLKKILAEHAGRTGHVKQAARHEQTILLVTHGTFGRALLSAIMKKKTENLYHLRLHNSSVSAFQIQPDFKYKTLYFNCIKHLE